MILDDLSRRLGAAFSSLGLDAAFGHVTISQRADLGQFQCNGAMQAAKIAKKSPRDIATDVLAAMGADPELCNLSIAGPGFINLSLTDEALARYIQAQAEDSRFGCDAVAEPIRLVIDYGGPNVAKAMHVGHLRASVIGESVKRIHRFLGHTVIGDVHLGDWGLPMGQLLALLKTLHPDWPWFVEGADLPEASPVSIEDLETLYPQAAQQCREDPDFLEAARQATAQLQSGNVGLRALWGHFQAVSIERLKQDFDRLGVSFDVWKGEASVADLIPDLVNWYETEGIARRDQGALIIDVATDNDNVDIPPLLLEKSDGAATYGTTDLATLIDRFQPSNGSHPIDRAIYIVDQRQSLHFVQVFRAALRGGIVPSLEAVTHAGFGTMNGTDGKPFKTRAGGVMRLHDLIDLVEGHARDRLNDAGLAKDLPSEEREDIARKVGLAALIFADLQNDRKSDYVFDPERFTRFEGKTGPYLLYSSVRMKAILNKAMEQGAEPGSVYAPQEGAQGEAERNLMLTLLQFSSAVARAGESHSPQAVAQYAYDLSQSFNGFYQAQHILSARDPVRQAGWLGLTRLTHKVLLQCLELLNIPVPDRM